MSVVKGIRAMVTGGLAIIAALISAQLYLGYGDILDWLRRQPVVNNVIIGMVVGVLALWCAWHYIAEWRWNRRGYRLHVFFDGETGEGTVYVLRQQRR